MSPDQSDPTAGPLRIALGEYDTGWHDPAGSLDRAGRLVARAAAAGADLVVLPEMCTTGFTMEAAAYAEPVDGRSARALADIALTHGVHLLAGLAIRSGGERAVFQNAALLFGPDGTVIADYRKQRLFAYGREHECYTAGEASVTARVGDVVLAPFICYDLRFPELFRAVSPRVDLIVLIANWPVARRPHWDVLVRARAVENQCWVVAVNRTGAGGGVSYDGGSVAYDPWGDPVAAPHTSDDEAPVVACIDPAIVTRVRARYPFVPDERRNRS